MTSIKILNKDNVSMRFVLEDADPAFAAELRRVMIGEIPTFAIQNTQIFENDSGLFDEVLAHRLGLIPLTWDQKHYNVPAECKCEGKGCSQCQAQLVLERQGPGYVYSKDLKTTDESVQPTDKNIIVVQLLETQKVKVECVASLGFGRDHAKHQAAIVGYQFTPKVTVKDAKKAAEVLAGTATVEGTSVKFADPMHADLGIARLEKLGDGANIEWDDTKIIFYVESVCALKPEEILAQALEIVQKKAEKFGKEIGKLK